VVNPIIPDRVKEEVGQVLDAGFIWPCRYAEWVSNIVPMEKKNTSKIRVCIYFHNLNKVTPKDKYPLPIADMLINNASGHWVISFLDGNASYNQIFMAEEDMSKTAFRCPGFISLFEWVVMTFGLKKCRHNISKSYKFNLQRLARNHIGNLYWWCCCQIG
jgi:hypothetical protein